jgi:hypothetical protein
MKGNFLNIKYYSKLAETKELIPLSALLLTIVLSLAACAGPAVEGARFRIAKMAGEHPIPLPIDSSEFTGTDIEAIKQSEVTTKGSRILRDKVLVDVNIAREVENRGLPDTVELNFTDAGQVQWFSLFYRDPPKTLVFRRSLADIQWLSIRELEQSRLFAEIDTVPRSVRRLSFGDGPLPPPWPVTIPKELNKAFGVQAPPDEPAAKIDGGDYSSTADSIRKGLEKLRPPDGEAQYLANSVLAKLAEVAEVPGIVWRLEVFAASEPVAFGVPDGTVFISDGLVKRLTEDELSSVISHEMGHIRYQHGRSLVRGAKAMGIILLIDQVVSIVTFGHPGATGATPEILLTGGYMDVITNPALGYSRTHEIEANYSASEILGHAGIAPDALFDALVKLGPVEPKDIKMGIYQKRSIGFANVHSLGQTTIDFGVMLDSGLVKGSSSSTQAPPPKYVVKQVLIDRKEPAYTVYVGIPGDDLPEDVEKELEEYKRLAKEEGMNMVGLDQFKEDSNNYIKARILKNDYPGSGVEKGIVKLIEKIPGVPFGLTWNGGIAFTYNDYQYAKRRYQQYIANPTGYEPERDPRADPVNPKGHLGPLLGWQ